MGSATDAKADDGERGRFLGIIVRCEDHRPEVRGRNIIVLIGERVNEFVKDMVARRVKRIRNKLID